MRMFLCANLTRPYGEVISIGVICDSDEECYLVSNNASRGDAFAKGNVIPVLSHDQRDWLNDVKFRGSFGKFLSGFEEAQVICRTPTDLYALGKAMIGGPASDGRPVVSVELWPHLSLESSTLEHNAICDARALRRDYVKVSREYGYERPAEEVPLVTTQAQKERAELKASDYIRPLTKGKSSSSAFIDEMYMLDRHRLAFHQAIMSQMIPARGYPFKD